MALYLLQIGGDFGIMTEAEILEAALTILHSRDRRVYESISSRVRAVLGSDGQILAQEDIQPQRGTEYERLNPPERH